MFLDSLGGVTAEAADYNPASTYTEFATLVSGDNTVKIDGVKYDGTNVADWYVIGYNSEAKTVTLLSKQSFAYKQFHNDYTSITYADSTIKTYVEGLAGAGQLLVGIKDALTNISVTDPEVTGQVPYLLNISEANSLSIEKKTGDGKIWWLRVVHSDPGNALVMRGDRTSPEIDVFNMTLGEAQDQQPVGVRPALQLDLSKVTFDSTTKTFSVSSSTVNVESVTLTPSTAQTIGVGGKVSFIAAVAPNNATDKTVKWGVGGTNANAVKLYSDADCTTEVGADATSTLTVYAKGISAGSATVTCTSNADSNKSASCDVTVNKGVHAIGDFTYTAPNYGFPTYDDTAKTATVMAAPGISGMGQVTVKYYSDEECTDEVQQTPTNVGTYYVGITVAEGDNYSATSTVLHDSNWKFTINRATPSTNDFTYSAPSDLTYDGTAKEATVVGASGMGQVTVKYFSDPECTAELVGSPTDVGTYYVGITAEEGTSYSAVSTVFHDASWQFTINKADQTPPAPPTEASVSVNSITLKAITNGEYKMGNGDTWQESPTFTGLTKNTEYSFYQRLKADANHNASPASTPVAINTADHTHQWSYAAGTGDGADTITATCADTDGGHGTPKTATLTIAAPTLTTYGDTGKSEAATLTGLEAFNTATGKTIAATEIKYAGRGTTTYAESDTAPTNAGKYTAKITVEGKTATVDYEIAKAATSVTTTPTAGETTYGQTLADSTLTGGTASVAGTFAWKNTTIAPAVSDSETTEYDVVFTPTDGNYSTAECKVKLTVNKADPTNTVGQLSAFVGQTLADVALPTADNGTWSWEEDTTAKLNDIGMTTHFAKFTPNDTNNYNTLDNVSVQIEVAEKPMAVPAAVTANSSTYDGTEKPLVNVDDSTLVGGTMQYALGTKDAATEEYTTSIPSKTDAGTYYVWYKVKGDENHSDTAPAGPVTVTISESVAETVTITFDEGEGTGTMAPVQIEKGSQYTFPKSSFIPPANKVFAHWKIGEKQYAVNDKITMTADLKVTAVWGGYRKQNRDE